MGRAHPGGVRALSGPRPYATAQGPYTVDWTSNSWRWICPGTRVATASGMTSDLDRVLWGLEAEAAEPSVIVDPDLEAFCVMRSRIARGTVPPRTSSSGRIPLKAILAYIENNSGSEDS